MSSQKEISLIYQPIITQNSHHSKVVFRERPGSSQSSQIATKF